MTKPRLPPVDPAFLSGDIAISFTHTTEVAAMVGKILMLFIIVIVYWFMHVASTIL